MKPYLFSLGAGLLVGVVYGRRNGRAPAPPVIALLGLFGILVGEQVTGVARRALTGAPVTLAWVRSDCSPRLLGTPAMDAQGEPEVRAQPGAPA